MVQEIVELNRIRLERDLTYQRLADETGISLQTLYRILNQPNARLRDRTLYKVQRFLRTAA